MYWSNNCGNRSCSLLAPIITDATFYGVDEIEVEYNNPNSIPVTAHGVFRDAGHDPYGGVGNIQTPANATAAYLYIPLDSSGQYEPGWTVTLYFTAAGYPDSATTTYTSTT